MKSKGMKKLLAVVMVLAMLIALFPAAVAEDGTAPGEEILAETLEDGMPEDSYEGALGDDMQAGLEEEASGELTETPDAGRTESAEESMGEAPEEAAEEAPTAPEEAAEETPEEPEERKDEDTEAEAEAGKEELDEGTLESADEAEEPSEEETEDKALPCGFRGLPEDYEFSEAELAAKRALTENGVVADLAVGEYAEGEVLFSAATREYAELVAEAYNAELAYFNGHFGKLYLTGATVEEAVTAAADMGLPLPAVEPNWRVSVPILPAAEGLNTAQALFEQQNWQSWMDSTADPDPYMSDPGGAYQYQHDMVNTYEAWGVSTGAGVTVAVVDSGVDYTHPDLAGKVIPGGDYVEGDGDPMDEDGHGTHVAGIIAAAMGNGEGGAGIAPDAKIYAVRVLDADGLGYNEWIIAGYYDAADSGAKIINMSLGGTRYSSIEEEAIRYAVEEKEATVVAAMGNDGSNIRTWPAGFDGVVAVAAVDAGGGLADYSDYGPWCDVAAPGSGIWSTTGGSYECWDGTSMATPVVAGVAALYMSRYGYTDPAAMEAILKKAVSKGPAGAGTGIIDASKLFAGDTTPPVIRLFEADGTEVTASGKVSPQGYLLVQSGRGITQATSFLLYTMDGKNPAVKNGNPTCGYLVSGVYAYEQELGGFRIPLGGFETDQSLTFKFMEVNGLAIPSKVSTLKVQIVPPSQDKLENLRINVQAPKSVTRGTSVTLTAEVWGSFDDAYGYTLDEKAENQTVVWSVAEPAGENWINASAGLLTVPVSFAGDAVVIRARSEAYDIEKDCSIGVESLPTVRSMRFTGKLRTLYTGEEYRLEAEALTITDVNGDPVDPRNASLKWSSSNTKVVSVVWDESGLPTFCANGKGSATVTGRTMDGSNQTVTLKLTVRPGVEMLTVTGQKIVAPGTSATYKVSAVTPKDAANKAVKWYVYTEDERITIDSKGKLTVPAEVSAETAFYVYAQPVLGAEAAVTGGAGMVAPKAQKLELRMNAAAAPKTLTLFSADLPETDGADNRAEIAARRVLVGGGNDDSGVGVVWTSSKPEVAKVEEDGSGAVTVRAKKTGTATVTAKVTDGSNKTARITVRVVNPVSHFIIRSKLPESLYCGRENMSYYAVGIGRSVGNSVIFGDTFGKPTNTKVTWSLKCYLTEFGAGNVRLSMTEFDPGSNITVKNGTLTVNRRFQNAWENMVGSDVYVSKDGGKAVIVCVTATATDGSGASADIWYYVNRTTTKAFLSDRFYVFSFGAKEPDVYSFSETKNTMTLALDSYMGIADVDYDGWYSGFTVSSSKPEVAGAIASGDRVEVYPSTETGTAKITVKTTDGSNRSLSFNVKVVE
ncbi:MAG: S8 family serine peptidase [Oscillospiraceae bacterium]|nr:S8 family serine peptidase [Oscillospiraceae bacterium]